jgi:hypothetical protein
MLSGDVPNPCSQRPKLVTPSRLNDVGMNTGVHLPSVSSALAPDTNRRYASVQSCPQFELLSHHVLLPEKTGMSKTPLSKATSFAVTAPLQAHSFSRSVPSWPHGHAARNRTQVRFVGGTRAGRPCALTPNPIGRQRHGRNYEMDDRFLRTRESCFSGSGVTPRRAAA